MKSIFGKLEDKATSGSILSSTAWDSNNLKFSRLDYLTRHWIKNLCLVIDEEVEALKEIMNNIEFKE